MIHPNLKQLSNSSCTTCHRCPRRYELEKSLDRSQQQEGNIDFDFGHLVGAGIQKLFVSRSVPDTTMELLSNWKRHLDDEDGEKKKKTFWFGMFAVEKFQTLMATEYGNYEVAILHGKPAIELGFDIDCGDDFHYRGFVDAVLQNSISKRLLPLECKTHGFSHVDDAQFKNSGQALGYSVILDSVAKELGLPASKDYEVLYPVWKCAALEWEPLKFPKTNLHRALWIKNLLLDIKRIKGYAEDNHFPMHGESCYDFFRRCQFFETCEFDNKFIFGDWGNVVERVEADSKYQFKFKLEDIINTQLEGLK